MNHFAVYLNHCKSNILLFLFWLHCPAHGIYFPDQGSNLHPQRWKYRVQLDQQGSPYTSIIERKCPRWAGISAEGTLFNPFHTCLVFCYL